MTGARASVSAVTKFQVADPVPDSRFPVLEIEEVAWRCR
jgi:hypothetical protein